MNRSLPIASLFLAAPVLLGFTSCDTVYSRTYSYQKTEFAVVTKGDGTKVLQKSYQFEPYEQVALARAEIDKEKRQADRLRITAQSSQKMSADRIGTDAPSLRMDSGLDSGLGALGGSSSSIPGLDAPASSPSMSTGIPGLDTPSMSAAPSMSGAPAMSGASMEGSSMMAPASGMAPAPAAGAAKPASTMLPGL